MTTNAEFEEFHGGAVGRLLGQLVLVTGGLHEAEEVVQEAFARAFIHWSRLRAYEVPEAWVRRVAMNPAAERARRLRRRARAILRAGPPPQAPQVSVEALDLLAALRTLPIRQRQALVLHHLVGLQAPRRRSGEPASGSAAWGTPLPFGCIRNLLEPLAGGVASLLVVLPLAGTIIVDRIAGGLDEPTPLPAVGPPGAQSLPGTAVRTGQPPAGTPEHTSCSGT